MDFWVCQELAEIFSNRKNGNAQALPLFRKG